MSHPFEASRQEVPPNSRRNDHTADPLPPSNAAVPAGGEASTQFFAAGAGAAGGVGAGAWAAPDFEKPVRAIERLMDEHDAEAPAAPPDA